MENNKEKKEENKIIDEFTRENIEKFGEICTNCKVFEAFCRCENSKYKLKK